MIRIVVKPVQVVLLAGIVLAVLFAFAWQSRLFGLGRQSQTVILPADGGGAATEARELEIVTILGFDAIPAIFNPQFVPAAEASNAGSAGQRYEPDEKVLGIDINGDTRAYSVPMLSRHEVVNDVVGGVPVAVTW